MNVIARDAARVLAHRVSIRKDGRVVRLTKDSDMYGRFMSALTVQIRDLLKDRDEAVVTYDFSIEVPPLLTKIATNRHLIGLVWPKGYVLWITRRRDTVEVASMASGEASQRVHHLVRIRAQEPPKPKVRTPIARRSIRNLFNN